MDDNTLATHKLYAKDIHEANVVAGWWVRDEYGNVAERNIGELIALMHSEVSEAYEGYIHDKIDDHLPGFPMCEVEIVDTAIRIYDALGYYGIPDFEHNPLADIDTLSFVEIILKLHGYLSEALEGFRRQSTEAGCAQLLFAVETCRRYFDWHGAGDEDTFEVILNAKLAYNAKRLDHKREHREALGGKRF